MISVPLSAKRIAIIEAYKTLANTLETLGGIYGWTQKTACPPGFSRKKTVH